LEENIKIKRNKKFKLSLDDMQLGFSEGAKLVQEVNKNA